MITTTWLCRNEALWISNHLLKLFKLCIQPTSIKDFGQPHRFIVRNNNIQITFYNSPRSLGYYSALPNYLKIKYVLCDIKETYNGRLKYEMVFGFDSEKMTFLELFDIIHRETRNLTKESSESDIDFIESQLKNNVLSNIDI